MSTTATAIEWTDRTWNPIRGCSPISPGCAHCYAERQAGRFCKPGEAFHGFVRITEKAGPRWTDKVELIESKLLEPLSWRKPCRVFVNSMSDLFHEALPDEAIDRVFAVMALCPHITFQVLTKRPERMLEWTRLPRPRLRSGEWWDKWREQCRKTKSLMYAPSPPAWPLPNVWLGVSTEDQKTADERIPLLLQTPAAVWFVSYEPALARVDLSPYLVCSRDPRQPRIDWLIVGGESGPGARPFDVEWPKSAIEQCKAAGVPVFMKQFGSNPRQGNASGNCRNVNCTHPDCGYTRWKLRDRKGGDPTEWPEWARVREFPRCS